MKKICIPLITVIVVVSIVLTGCIGAPAPEAPPEEPSLYRPGCSPEELGLELNPYEGLAIKPDGTPYRVAFTPFFLGVDYMINAEGIIKSLITRAGAEYFMANCELDPERQISIVEDLIAAGQTDALIQIPVDEWLLTPVNEQAMAAGIPVFDWGIDLKSDAAYVTSVQRPDWGPGGSDVVGQFFVDIAEEKNIQINIFEVWCLHAMELNQFRHTGFHKPLDGHPLITVMESSDSEVSDEITADLVIDAFTSHPELNGLYCMGGGGTGGIRGLEAIGRLLPPDDPNHVWSSFNDTDTLTIETMDAGELDACGSHNPWDESATAVKCMLLNVVCGMPVPKKVYIPYMLVTSDNIDTLRILGAPVYPRMPAGQWDLWPVLDTSLGVPPGIVTPEGEWVGIPTPTVELRMEQMGY